MLRARWRTASIAAGWRYPSDWGVPEVDAVCTAVVRGTDLAAALTGLGRARAQTGAGLAETLTDLAALHAVLSSEDDHIGLVAADPDAAPTALVRATALAWADAAEGELRNAESTENLTSLSTSAYLRTRLGEIYRKAARDGSVVADTHTLLVVTLDLATVTGWSRLMAMVLVADVLREVFDGGETVAILGPSVAVVLAERDPGVGGRTLNAGWLITERLTVDPRLATGRRPWLRMQRLPQTQDEAWRLLRGIGRG